LAYTFIKKHMCSFFFSLLFFLLLSPVHSWGITESTETDRNGPPKSLISTLLLPSAAPRNEDCPTIRIFYWRFLPQNLEILLPVVKEILENGSSLMVFPKDARASFLEEVKWSRSNRKLRDI
jgi:hypothetical protein